jgi:hypothetical protein
MLLGLGVVVGVGQRFALGQLTIELAPLQLADCGVFIDDARTITGPENNSVRRVRGIARAYGKRQHNPRLGELALKTRSPAVVAALLVIALAGCGSSASSSSAPSLSAFKSGFAADKAQFRKLGLDLQHAITGASSKTDAQLAAEIGALSTRAREQASQLSQLKPPAKFQGTLRELAAAFNAVAGDLNQISSAATKHNAQAARAATVTLLRDAAKVKATDKTLTASLGLPATP